MNTPTRPPATLSTAHRCIAKADGWHFRERPRGHNRAHMMTVDGHVVTWWGGLTSRLQIRVRKAP